MDAFTNAFNRGGAIKVDQAMIDALGKKHVISLGRGMSYSVLNVIQKAAEPGSNITQLDVSFTTVEQFESALRILAKAFRTSDRQLRLYVENIGDASVQCDTLGGSYYIKYNDIRNKTAFHDSNDYTGYIVHLVRNRSGVRFNSATSHVIYADKLVGYKEMKDKALADGILKDVLDSGGNFEEAFEAAGGEVKSLDANGVDVDELGEVLEGWFSEVRNRNNGQHWFLELDMRDDGVWQRMEKIAEVINEINPRFEDKTLKIFMHLDRANGKIFFNKKWSGLAQEGGTLVWDWYALSFLPPADIAHHLSLSGFKNRVIRKFGEFAKAVAENTSITSIKFNANATKFGDYIRKMIIAVIGKEEFKNRIEKAVNTLGK